jgi:hypothetical protein
VARFASEEQNKTNSCNYAAAVEHCRRNEPINVDEQESRGDDCNPERDAGS